MAICADANIKVVKNKIETKNHKPMKITYQILILIFAFMSCERKTDQNHQAQQNEPVDQTHSDAILKLSPINFLSGQLLIGKRHALKGFSSLNIAGHRSYELDGKGNITSTYDISNNYGVFTYDQKERLIKAESKQHNPPEIYYKTEYEYSSTDQVIKIIKTSYKNNQVEKEEVIEDQITLHADSVKNDFFAKPQKEDYFLNPDTQEIITFKDDMTFCCGVMMKGTNKLTYYLNQNELIDSLVITGLESQKKLKFEYEYK